MDINIRDIENSEKELVFTLTPQDLEPYLNAAARRLAQDIKIKGFREGRAPRNVVENTFGRERVWSEASTDAMEQSYQKALSENDIEPIGRPSADIIKLVPGNNFEFKITIPVLPQIELPDYKKIAAQVLKKERQEIKVEEKEVDDALKWLQRSRVAHYPNAKEQKEEDLPTLDDAFAESVGQFKNLNELKNNIRRGIHAEKEQRERERAHIKILAEIMRQTPFEASPMLIEQELDKMENEFMQQILQMSIQFEDYLKQIKKTKEEMREGWREKAQERAGAAIILRIIADVERIEISPEEVEKEASHYLSQFDSVEEARRQVDPSLLKYYIRGILRNKKVFELLERSQESKNTKTPEQNSKV